MYSKMKKKTEEEKFLRSSPLHPPPTHYRSPSHSISCRYFECVYWATLRLRYAAATISIIIGGALHHHPHPATPPSTSVAIFITLWFSILVLYVAILKTFHVKKLPNSNELKLSPYITEKITAPNNKTVTFIQNYLQVLLKVTFSSFPWKNKVKTPYK